MNVPTLKQYIEYLNSLIPTFGENTKVYIKSVIGIDESGTVIVDDDVPAMMASEDSDGNVIFIMNNELKNYFVGVINESSKESSLINPTTGENYSTEKKIII